MQDNVISFFKINPFRFKIRYLEIDAESPNNVYDQHIHQECEIYINISGDVSFMVEDRIYPVSPGNVVITRPYEYHHCIYNSNAAHKHYWILFNSDGNEELLDLFFKREAGEDNLISFPIEDCMELSNICREMLDKNRGITEQYLNFFRIIEKLKSGHTKKSLNSKLSDGLISALDKINKNPGEALTVGRLAEDAHMSINTFERHFKKYIGMSPSDYIRQKRLALSAALLANGYSVQEASEISGFCDYSHFISVFKKNFGVTPLKYKKMYE